MGVSAAGEIVLVPFPFSDLSATKVRPAIRLADAGRGDWILCQVTSNPYGDPDAIPLATSDFSRGAMQVSSFARPGKLFTANASLIGRSVATLDEAALRKIVDAIIALLRP
jgi:mRNA interferase MazF